MTVRARWIRDRKGVTLKYQLGRMIGGAALRFPSVAVGSRLAISSAFASCHLTLRPAAAGGRDTGNEDIAQRHELGRVAGRNPCTVALEFHRVRGRHGRMQRDDDVVI